MSKEEELQHEVNSLKQKLHNKEQPRTIKVWQLLLIILAMFIVAYGLVAGLWQAGYDQRIKNEQEVLRQCTFAHKENNGASEAQCGLLQDKANVEFVCSQDKKNCWVEL